jgi:hypothetical protein
MNTTTAALPATIGDGFDLAPDDDAKVVGHFLKFVKGGWFISNETARLNGTKLVACDHTRCWQKWHNQRIVASIFFEPGKPFPASALACEAVDDGEPGEWQASGQAPGLPRLRIRLICCTRLLTALRPPSLLVP